MKSTVIVLCALCASASVFAQNYISGGEHGIGSGPVTRTKAGQLTASPAASPATRGDRVALDLGLNATQRARLRLVLDEQRVNVDRYIAEQLSAGKDPSAKAIQAIVARAQADTLAKLRTLLSAGQWRRLQDSGGASTLTETGEGILIRIRPGDGYCDTTGKCVAL
jgi:parvulin-like peptidyl-prolyl isomerase